MSMITKGRAAPTGKKVLLFSGGMDSVCFNHLLKPDVLLYVPSHAVYEAQERKAVEALLKKDQVVRGREFICLEGALDLSRWERDDLIVPNRNAHLVLLAANYGEQIYLSSVDGDRSNDKDAKFYDRMNGLLNHMHAEQHWTEARRFDVDSPFKHLTKTKLVERFLTERGDPELMSISYSCYEGEDYHCGECKACFRKRVALENNGVALPLDYWGDGSFWETKWFDELYPSIRVGAYRGKEDNDVMWFLRHNGLLAAFQQKYPESVKICDSIDFVDVDDKIEYTLKPKHAFRKGAL